MSNTMSYLFGADNIDLNVPSLTVTPARHFATADALDQETMNARIWLGIHFRKAMTDGNQLGHEVSDFAISQYFQATDGRCDDSEKHENEHEHEHEHESDCHRGT